MSGKKQSSANTTYTKVKDEILAFTLMPSQHLNEVTLAQKLSVSRTPLREALNRLAAEGMLTSADRGFAVPYLDPLSVQHLFEIRSIIEQASVRLACTRARKEDLENLEEFVDKSANSDEKSVNELLKLDRAFHEQVARLTENPELVRSLQNINDRIHLVRWAAMEGRRAITQDQHRQIVVALCKRDEERAAQLMSKHILHRKEEIYAAVMKAYAHAHSTQFQTSGFGAEADGVV